MKNNIEVVVDPRTELMGIMLLLSSFAEKYPFLTTDNGLKEYRDKIYNHFLPFKNHKCIEILNYFTNTYNFSYNAPFDLAYSLNIDFTVREMPCQSTYSRLKEDEKIVEFLEGFSDFAKKSNFNEFYKENENLYNYYINLETQDKEKYPLRKYISDYYGIDTTNAHYQENLVFSSCGGAYGIEVDKKIICVQTGFTTAYDNIYKFSSGTSNTFSHLLHEYSHPIINPLTDKYIMPTFKLKNSDIPIEKILDVKSYRHYPTIINEYLIRASQIRYAKKYLPENYYSKLSSTQKSFGFTQIDDFEKLLIEYEENRDKYKTIEEYFPVMKEKINDIFKAKLRIEKIEFNF